MWDAKEKVSPRARFDRPKAFKLPPARSTEESEIENIKKLIEKKPRGRNKSMERLWYELACMTVWFLLAYTISMKDFFKYHTCLYAFIYNICL